MESKDVTARSSPKSDGPNREEHGERQTGPEEQVGQQHLLGRQECASTTDGYVVQIQLDGNLAVVGHRTANDEVEVPDAMGLAGHLQKVLVPLIWELEGLENGALLLLSHRLDLAGA